MPINVYRRTDPDNTQIAWLCDGSWSLPEQVDELVRWLSENVSSLDKASYVADIGFTIRPDACGGGAALDPLFMRTMADAGIELFLSEYPPDWNEWMTRQPLPPDVEI